MDSDFEPQIMEWDFNTWTAREMFEFLVDMHQIPYEEEFENYRYLKNDLLRWCKETYEHQI
jgi:hypothetical protein